MHRLHLLAASLFCLPMLNIAAQLTLIPQPRQMQEQRTVPIGNGLSVLCNGCDPDDAFAAQDLSDGLRARGVQVISGAPVTITLLRSTTPAGRQALGSSPLTPEMQAEGYAIIAQTNGLAVVAAAPAGLFYGAQTVKQLVDAASSSNPAGPVLHLVSARDWPAMRYRGVHDDLSRGPVPTLDFQKKQIRTFAAYKINVYSPYFENTMEYSTDPLAAPPGGSITAAEARELVAYAAKYHVMVIPEQEAFGHLHFLLEWEKYTDLAETPHGHVLAPGAPGTIPFITRIFGQLAKDYPAPLLHLGADETFELGKGATKADVDARGLGPVYLDFMQRIVTALKPLDRRFLFWGDIAYKEPALLKAAPQDFKNNTIAVAWEYNPHPTFLPYVKPYTDAGIECWVAPGVNNWNRPWPDNNLALPNIQGFTAQGQASGCTGQLNTVWDDDGEALFNANWYGILYGATAAWQPGTAPTQPFEHSYGRVFHGDPTGKVDEAQLELTACNALLKDVVSKGGDANDFLFWIDPFTTEGQVVAAKLRPLNRELRLHAEQALILVRQARAENALREPDALDVMELAARRIDLIGQKFQISDEIATMYADAYALQASKVRTDRSDLLRYVNGIAHPNSVQGKMEDLRNEYSLLHDLYEHAWLQSYRPYYLNNMLQRYTMQTEMWISRGDKVRAALRGWRETSTLPPAAQLGIPEPAPQAVPAPADISSPAKP